MSEKDFRRFMLLFLGNFLLLAVLVTLLILAANGVLPDIVRKISLILIIADAVFYGRFMTRAAKKSGVSSPKKRFKLK